MSPCSGARVFRDKGGVVGQGGHIPSVQGLYLASLGGTESAIGHCAHGPASSGSVTCSTRRPFWSKRIFQSFSSEVVNIRASSRQWGVVPAPVTHVNLERTRAP